MANNGYTFPQNDLYITTAGLQEPSNSLLNVKWFFHRHCDCFFFNSVLFSCSFLSTKTNEMAGEPHKDYIKLGKDNKLVRSGFNYIQSTRKIYENSLSKQVEWSISEPTDSVFCYFQFYWIHSQNKFT